jgi:ribosome-associated translation inhibitor RaiA
MIKLDHGNVLLKPSHRKQIMAWLRRSLRLGERLGNFVLNISMRRSGHHYEVHANVHDKAGDFALRSRGQDFWTALRDLVKGLSHRLHDQYVHRTAIA